MSESDSSLIAEFNARRSEAAFAALVRQHLNLVFGTAMRQVGEAGAAEEITQNVFVALAQSAGKLGSHPTIAGWLHQTTLNKSREWLRGELRRRKREQTAFNLQSAHAEGDSVWAALVPLLDEALLELREPDRQAVVLHFLEGRNFQEVGSVLGVGEDAARKRVNRCLDQLTHFFRRHGFATPALTASAPLFVLSGHAAPTGLATSITNAAVAMQAASSTLTLVKGALKIMAWTKAKTIAIATAAVLLATTATVAVWSYHRYAPEHATFKMKPGNTVPMVDYSYSRAVLLLATDGSLWSWGEDRLGAPVLGLPGKRDHTTSLRRIGRENDWTSISAGFSHCLAIKSDGSLWAWGQNFFRELGDDTKLTRATPVPSVPGNDWKLAAAGQYASYAIKTNGTLWAWGNNAGGWLGLGDTNNSAMARQIGDSTNWSKIWAGSIQTMGLQNDGSLWFWGSLGGDGRGNNQIKVPTRVSADTNWVDACFGYFTMFAIKADGTLWCWGNRARFYTQSGDSNFTLTPTQVGNDDNWVSCHAGPGGFYHLLRKKDGSLWAMDASEHRIVKPDPQYKPIQFRKVDFPHEIASYVAGGDDMGVVITTDGEIWTWGRVIGEHTHKDFFDAKGRRRSSEPPSRTIQEPWRVSFLD